MDPRFQTSFIPKKPISSSPSIAPSTVSIFLLISSVIFIIALALSGGVYFYKSSIIKQIAENETSLDRTKEDLQPDTVHKIVRLDSRLNSGKQLLNSHIAVTPFFDFLSAVTLKSVRFRDFDFTYLAPDKIQVKMTGEALSYAAVAVQSDILNGRKELKNTILSDMALEPQGTVSFSVSTVVIPSLLSYASTLSTIPAMSASTTKP